MKCCNCKNCKFVGMHGEYCRCEKNDKDIREPFEEIEFCDDWEGKNK